MNEQAQDLAVNQGENAASVPQEKLLPQTHVNALIGSAKQKGYEKGRQDAIAELATQPIGMQQATQVPQPQPPMAPAVASANAPVGGDQIRQIASEEIAKQHQEWQKQILAAQHKQQADQAAQQIIMKINEAKTRIPDYDKVVDMNTAIQMPDILTLAHGVDNTGDVLYDLMKNPGKRAQIRGVPEPLARLQIKQLSDSIKQNQMAAYQPISPEPLDQIKPSNIGLGNGSKNTVSQLRDDPRYRG